MRGRAEEPGGRRQAARPMDRGTFVEAGCEDVGEKSLENKGRFMGFFFF